MLHLKTEEEEEPESEGPSSAYWYFFDPNFALCGIHPYEPDLEPEEVRETKLIDLVSIFSF